MKRNIFLLGFIFIAMNAHATAGHGYTININNDASISIYYLFGSGDYGPAYSEESRVVITRSNLFDYLREVWG